MYTPTQEDIARYRHLRTLSIELNNRMVKAIPPGVYTEIGEALGILRDGILVFESEDMASVMADACLYEWFENGKNLVEVYAEAHPAKAGSDERYLFDAYLQAKYRIIAPQEMVPGAGMHGRDILNDEDLFVMDRSIAQSVLPGNAALATRTMPLGEYSMTGGAVLPIVTNQEVLDSFKRMQLRAGGQALPIIATCLAAGAAEHVSYSGTNRKPKRREPKHQWKRR